MERDMFRGAVSQKSLGTTGLVELLNVQHKAKHGGELRNGKRSIDHRAIIRSKTRQLFELSID